MLLRPGGVQCPCPPGLPRVGRPTKARKIGNAMRHTVATLTLVIAARLRGWVNLLQYRSFGFQRDWKKELWQASVPQARERPRHKPRPWFKTWGTQNKILQAWFIVSGMNRNRFASVFLVCEGQLFLSCTPPSDITDLYYFL